MRHTTETTRTMLITIGLLMVLSAVPTHTFAGADTVIHEMVLVPDSVHLATDVYLPAESGKFPTVLIRTPYTGQWLTGVADRFAESDYATVIQYVRGINGSEGQFFPFVYEKGDGIATLEWIASQPWSDGSIGMWGASYLSFCGFELAATGHPALKALINVSGWADMNAFMARGGAFRLLDHLPWIIIQMSGQRDIPEQAWDGIFRTTPLAQLFMGAGDQVSGMAEDPYPFENVNIPILHITGWNDYLYRSSLLAHSSISSSDQKIIIGPWTHNQMFSSDNTAFGDEDFGQSSVIGLDSILTLTVAWFDKHIRGIDSSADQIPNVEYFVMNENRWASSDQWPPSTVSYREMYLSGSEKPGLLTDEQPSSESTASFAYDPNDPVPTIGGVGGNLVMNVGIKDQSPIVERSDVLTFDSSPLEDDLTLAGPITAIIYASTDSIDTDFTAKLIELRSDGYARIIEDGIIRAQYRDGGTDSKPLIPNEIYEYRIEIGQTAITIPAGSALRLEISSSNFPKFDRNPNTGEDAMTATVFRVANQTVFMSSEHPSRIVLPVFE